MSYASRLLSRGEEIVFETRQHWFSVFAKTWIWLILLILGAALLIWVNTGGSGLEEPSSTILLVGSIVLIAVSLIRIGLTVWAWQNQEFLVTTRRIIRCEGIFNKEMSDSSLEKVNDARLSQSIFGRIFDFGTLDILTAADEESTIADFPMMADPVKFKVAMLNQKEMMERPDLAPARREQGAPSYPPMQRVPPEPPRAGSTSVRPVEETGDLAAPVPAEPAPAAPAQATGEDLGTTLQRLADLRDKGLITPEEYESKKQQLLERL